MKENGTAVNKRLIDATDFIKTFWQRVHDGEIVTLMDVEHAIINAPTVDAVEVVHGRWVKKHHDDPFGGYCLYHCSNCDTPNAKERKFCPECGAKMDLKGE